MASHLFRLAMLLLCLLPGAAYAVEDGAQKQAGLGSLSVLITPPGAVGVDAKWQVDGGAFQDSEATLNGLSVGVHTVCFQTVTGFVTPDCFQVTIRANETTFATGVYVPQTGGITVAISPAGAIFAGGQWSVSGRPYRDNGFVETGLAIGKQIVTFKAIPGYITPGNLEVVILADEVTPAIGVYIPQTGGITVALSPTAAVSAGAQWQIDGGVFRNSGSTANDQALGTHTISFRTIAGYVTPPNQTVTVRANQVTSTTALYTPQTGGITVTLSPPGAIAAGAQWQIDNGPLHDSGVTENGITSGPHTLSFSTIPGYTKPANKRVVIIANQVITETGEYVSQTGGIKVNLGPEAAVAAGAQWQVDGGALRDNAATVFGLSLGSHTVTFTKVPGFSTPAPQTLTVASNQVNEISVEYQAPSGGITVNITPPEAVAAGAQWKVDNGGFRNSGTTASNLTLGAHTVSFSEVPGFLTPNTQTITVTEDQIVSATGAYTAQTGSLTVLISPQEAVTAGAQWSVDGGALRNSGASVTGLALGAHTVSFTDIPGFATPGDRTVTIAANQTTTETGVYTTETGVLTVYLTPTPVIAAGALWQVDDRPLQASGTVAADLAIGKHTIYFRAVEGYVSPPSQTVTIRSDSVAEVTGEYQPRVGGLTVTLNPPEAVAAGAQWQVDGGPVRNSGATVNGLAFGAHTVSFREVPGFTTPANVTVNIVPDQITTLSETYPPQSGSLRVTLGPPSAVSAGAQWQVDGGPFQNSGATVSALAFGTHTVSFKAVSGFPTPADKVVVIKGNQLTNATAEYSTQTGGLRVTLTPAAAVSAGAQWRVDGGTLQNSGTTVNRLSVGTHTVSFKSISGFPTPEEVTVTVQANQIASATGAYGPATGGVRVSITPPAAIEAGAQWRVDDGPLQDSGATVNGLSAGAHSITFSDAAGFDTPAAQSVTIAADEVLALTGAYAPQSGSVLVTLSPASAVAAGALWRLDNGAEQTSGTTLNNVSAGTHTISFGPASGFTAPASQTVNVVAGQTLSLSGAYSESGACCAGSAPVKSLKEAINFYAGDLSLLFGAMLALIAMSRFKRLGG